MTIRKPTDKGKLAVMLGRKTTEPEVAAGCVAKGVEFDRTKKP